MNFVKNIILLIVVLILSYFTASCFGAWYDKFAPQHDSLFGASKNITNGVVGLPFAYVFFTAFLFKLFGSGNKKHWIICLLVPAGLVFGLADLQHIYLPIILSLVAFYLAKVILMIYAKTKTSHA